MKKKIFLSFVVLIICLSLFAGASKEKAATSESISGTMKVVATSESYKTLFEKFTQETGVNIEMLSMSSGEVLSKLRAAGGSCDFDLWFGGGADAFIAAKEDGFLAKTDFKAASSIDKNYKDSENYWFSKGLTIVGFLINNKIAEKKGMPIPQTWDDLLKPIYKGEIVMSNPAISGTNYGAIFGILGTKGSDGWKYLTDLNKNIAYYSRRGSDPKNKVIADEYAVGITYIDGTIEKLLDEYDVTIVYPKDGIPFIPDGVAAMANATNTKAAQYFIEWLFSNDENLQLLAKIDNKTSIKVIKPNLKGVELNYSTKILMKEDLSKLGSERETILSKFEEVSLGKTT